ncbi:MAG: PAS domain S-box protein, partial [Alphaproteobacteria bacterium]|nr:PAS domain S-box protein [Alphaproteobacteria bacterium]
MAAIGSWLAILAILATFWALSGTAGITLFGVGEATGHAAAAGWAPAAWPLATITGWALTTVLTLVVGGVVLWRYHSVLRVKKVMSELRVSQLMANKSLSQSERRVHGIMDHATDGITTIGKTGKIESFNRAAERMFGYKAEEVIGENVSILMTTADARLHDGHLNKYLQSGKGKVIGKGPREMTGRHKDGSTFPMELSVAEIMLGEDRIFIGITRDIHQIKQAESDATERSRLLNIVIENMDQGIAVMDPNRKLVAFNRKFAELAEAPEGSLRLGMDGTEILALGGEEAVPESGPGGPVLESAVHRELHHSDGRPLIADLMPLPSGGIIASLTDMSSGGPARGMATPIDPTPGLTADDMRRLEADFKSVKGERKALEEGQKLLAQDRRRLEQDRQRVENRGHQADAHLENARKESEQARKEALQAQGALGDAREEARRILEEFQRTQVLMASAQSAAETAEHEALQAREGLGSAQTELSRAQTEAQRVRQELEQTHIELGASKETAARAKRDAEGLRNDMRRTQEDIAGYRQTTQMELHQAQDEIQQTQQELSQAQLELAASQETASRAQQQAERLRDDLDGSRDQAQKDLQQARQEVERVEADIQRLKTEHSRAQQEAEQLRAELGTSLEKGSGAEDEARRIQGDLRRVQQALSKAEERMAEAQGEAEQARVEAARMGEELQESRKALGGAQD